MSDPNTENNKEREGGCCAPPCYVSLDYEWRDIGDGNPSMNDVAATCSAFERAAQICRYYLKNQNFPSRWEDKSEYEKGIQIACENLAKSMLEEVGKFKVEPGESLEYLAQNWERAGFFGVAADIRSHNAEAIHGEKGATK